MAEQMTEDTDWALAARAHTDHAALAELYTRHRAFVFRVAWGLLNERAAADDVVQEVFLRLGAGRLRVRPRARFTTWFYQVALNTAREQARGRWRMWGDADAAETLASIAAPDMTSARVDTLTDLGRALASLPLRQREVVILRYLEGFDTAETAAILGCRQGTVKAHLHRATQSLKSHLT